MKISGSIALVTGANRGLGREFTRQLLERGATTVYATARHPERIDLPGVTALPLDITDPGAVAAAASSVGDVDLLVNNAGISTRQDLVSGDLDQLRLELETHVWGTLSMIRAFAPALARSTHDGGGGAIVDVLSALSFVPFVGAGGYAMAKAAEWMLTNQVRLELATQGTQVLGAHLASTDTDMMAGYDVAKNDPADVVSDILEGLEAGATEVLADEDTRGAKRAMAGVPGLSAG